MKRIIFSVFLAAAFGSINAQSAYQPSEAIRQAQTEFQDKKFGIFLHWGLFSMLCQGDWVMLY